MQSLSAFSSHSSVCAEARIFTRPVLFRSATQTTAVPRQPWKHYGRTCVMTCAACRVDTTARVLSSREGGRGEKKGGGGTLFEAAASFPSRPVLKCSGNLDPVVVASVR